LSLPRITAVWVVFWVAFFAATHTPKPERLHLPTAHLDKVIHFAGYAALATLCATHARSAGRPRNRRWFITWIVILAVYAAFDEITQPLVNRSASVFDWLADMLGVLAAFLIIRTRDARK